MSPIEKAAVRRHRPQAFQAPGMAAGPRFLWMLCRPPGCFPSRRAPVNTKARASGPVTPGGTARLRRVPGAHQIRSVTERTLTRCSRLPPGEMSCPLPSGISFPSIHMTLTPLTAASGSVLEFLRDFVTWISPARKATSKEL